MDKAVIIGAYEFLGFSLCESLLEKGLQVDGIHIQSEKEDIFLEEKRLEIGRNANFTEWTLENWLKKQLESNETPLVIISIYDYHIKKKTHILLEDHQLWNILLPKLLKAKTDSQVVLLLPIQYLLKDARSGILDDFRSRNGVQLIFLPTLFGPWQAPEFIFQQTFLHEFDNGEKPVLQEQEWVFDAIYIEDASNQLIEMIESKSMKDCFLQSSEADSWKNCAEQLGIQNEESAIIQIDKSRIDTQIPVVQVENKEMASGLKKQKEHLQRIMSLRNIE